MPFNSISFFIFFLLFTTVYYLIPSKGIKIVALIFGSYFFYAYAGIHHLAFLLLVTAVTYMVSQMNKKRGISRARLLSGIICILALLLASKYASVLVGNGASINFIGGNLLANLVVPVGISFYSLQAISLLVDTYRGQFVQPLTLKNTSLYLSFFPQAASGPIHRASELIPQFDKVGNFISEHVVFGLKTMLYGYFCKLIIADKISLLISPIFNAWDKFDGLSLFTATLFYSFQIYFDFWGYSLIAIGVGRVLGFNINVNFIAPYRASSFRAFWHRWHITLSRWMHDYIYIPLGGNRLRYSRFCIAIVITFLLSGIWHGVAFNFLLWGAVHAGLYLFEDMIRRQFKNTGYNQLSTKAFRIFQPLRWFVFFLIISFTWLIFRTENMNSLYGMVTKIFSVSNWSVSMMYDHYFTGIHIAYLFVISVAFVISHAFFKFIKAQPGSPPLKRELVIESMLVCMCLFAIILLGDMGGQEFLYFKF